VNGRVVVDASVVFGWTFGEPDVFERAKAVLRALKTMRMLVPVSWQLEVTNVLLVKERQKRIDEPFVRRCLRHLEELSIDIDVAAATSSFDRVMPLARRHQLSSYDAAYLELSLRENTPLATFDGALRDAAKREGVPLFEDLTKE